MNDTLEGKVAIVTGSAGGIGAVYAETLCKAGAAVVIADLNGAGAIAKAAALEAAGHAAKPFTVDIRDADQCAAMVASAEMGFGGLDIIVNNAAYMPPVKTGLLDYPMAEWQRQIDVNLTGTFNCCRAAAPAMIRRGGGRIVNQSSIGAYAGGHAYSVAKAGIQIFSVQLADELGRHGITVNCIAPGAIKTPAGDEARDESFLTYLSTAPLGGIGAPEELLGALFYFLSDGARWVTGQTIRVDGGLIRRPL